MAERDPKELLKKVIDGSATEQEKALLDSWYFNWRKDEPSGLTEEDHLAAKAAIYGRLPQPEPMQPVRLWPRIAVAASVLLIAGAGLWLFNASRHAEFISASPNYAHDIAPGKQGATITLASGKVIVLSDKKNGVIIGKDLKYDDNTVISNEVRDLLNSTDKRSLPKGRDDGEGAEGRGANSSTLEMTASTAKGQTYQFTLPDGTKVWLNAASSIKFPSVFRSSNRIIELTGEAYLEVAKNKAHPFIVQTDRQKLEVLGTHFNISAYPDEASVKTALLEGSVRITAGRHLDDRRGPEVNSGRVLLNGTDKRSLLRRDDGVDSKVLKPNQQSIVASNQPIKVKTINAEDAIAWKDGLFTFDDEPLEDIMRRVGRWYNVEIQYADGVDKKRQFGGSVSRFDKVSTVLDMLQLTKNIHFKIEGRRIVVMK